jgi:hypothetical protein
VEQEALAAKAVWEHDVETDRRRRAEKVAAPPAQAAAADHEHIAGAVGDDAFALINSDYAKTGTVSAGVAAWACWTYYKAGTPLAKCAAVFAVVAVVAFAPPSRLAAQPSPSFAAWPRAVLASPLSLDELTTTN